jgi:small subunit ribosomal protein S4
MGDPRKNRKQYKTPAHPWRKDRLDAEAIIKKDYSLKNKTEIYKMSTILSDMKTQVKILSGKSTSQAVKEKDQLMQRLLRLGLLQAEDPLDKVLGLAVKDILERRLQTLVFRKGLARSMKQARQFITHGHVLLGDRAITSPSYLVGVGEESRLTFVAFSPLNNPDHPERAVVTHTAPKEQKPAATGGDA